MRLNRVGCTTSKSAEIAPNEIEVPPYFRQRMGEKILTFRDEVAI